MSLAGDTLLGASFLLVLSSCKSVVRSPPSAADDGTAEACLIYSPLLSRSLAIVLRYCNGEHSLKHRLTTDSCTLRISNDHFRQVTAHPLVISFLLSRHLAQSGVHSAGCCRGVPGYAPHRTPELSLQWPWKRKSRLYSYMAYRNLRKPPELFTTKTLI